MSEGPGPGVQALRTSDGGAEPRAPRPERVPWAPRRGREQPAGARGRRQPETRVLRIPPRSRAHQSGALRRSTRRARARRRTGSDRRPIAERGGSGAALGRQLQPRARGRAPVGPPLRARSHFRSRRPSRRRACSEQRRCVSPPAPAARPPAAARAGGAEPESSAVPAFRTCRPWQRQVERPGARGGGEDGSLGLRDQGVGRLFPMDVGQDVAQGTSP